MRLRIKIWLEDNGKVFGDGAYDLLNRVRRLGSLRQAAKEIGMSYAQAWKLVRGLEARLGFRLIESRSGGGGGGGSTLTERACGLLDRYAVFRQDCQEYVSGKFAEYLGSEFGPYAVVPPGLRGGEHTGKDFRD
ncbi:MAG: winged helix-turn-helix domain-containing protein [Ignavibacteriales bacterium]